MADADPLTRLNAALSGRYRIERELGAGGMATVYLASDLRHERRIAFKVLRPELAAVLGAERFLAEIRTTANLQHPHILPLFDSGEADGFLFYVMPYVEGESLRARLDRERQLPVEEAVRIATAVASALDYAHRHGVIHRDIKPANILLHDGEPVVADFGIALAVNTAGGGRLTETGLSLGTPHYMSPEQATGDQRVGPATDIWALGCVLYETLVGEPPYRGSTPQAILGKIITSEPEPVTAERKSVPANVEAVIRKALEKVPADRFSSARGFAIAVADPGFRHGEEAISGARAAARPWRAAALGAAPVLLLLIAGLAWDLTRRDPPAPVVSFRLAGLAENHAPGGLFQVGPQNAGFIYQGLDDRLWYRRWNDLTPRPLGVFTPAFNPSPDWTTMSVMVGGELQIVPLDGGPGRILADSVVASANHANWGRDGYVYFTGLDGQMRRVRERGGPVEHLNVELGEGEAHHHPLLMLPGGTKGVFLAYLRDGGCRIWGIDLETRERRLLAEGLDPHVTPTGHLVFTSPDGQLMAATLDADALELGAVVALGLTIRGFAGSDRCTLMSSISTDGTLAYWEGGSDDHEMVWVTRSGTATPVDPSWRLDPGRWGAARSWSLSPDETRLAVRLVREGKAGIWIKELPSGPLTPLTSTEVTEGEDWRGRFLEFLQPPLHPTWLSRDTLLFLSDVLSPGDTLMDVLRLASDGTGRPEPLYQQDERVLQLAVVDSARRWLLLHTALAQGDRGAADILALRLGVDAVARPLLANPAYLEAMPAVSPDGRWLVYMTNESGREEVVARPFPNVADGRYPVSVDGGIGPVWSPDATEIFYVSGNQVMAARVEAAPRLRVIDRRPLFTIGPEYHRHPARPFAAVASDGRFLMMRRTEATFVLVQNWFELLKERVPR